MDADFYIVAGGHRALLHEAKNSSVSFSTFLFPQLCSAAYEDKCLGEVFFPVNSAAFL